ncbi:MAG: hypothetical protein HW421_1395 [Ignavibacteria bacterium]|nr:hypothetical protein [Ignavibacteria bacterium]
MNSIFIFLFGTATLLFIGMLGLMSSLQVISDNFLIFLIINFSSLHIVSFCIGLVREKLLKRELGRVFRTFQIVSFDFIFFTLIIFLITSWQNKMSMEPYHSQTFSLSLTIYKISIVPIIFYSSLTVLVILLIYSSRNTLRILKKQNKGIVQFFVHDKSEDKQISKEEPKEKKSKILEIVSDEQTIFEFSPQYPKIPKNTEAVIPQFLPEEWLRADREYPEIQKANWISHARFITNQEALNGGEYHYKREFDISEIRKITEAKISFIVDDLCEIKLNNKELCEKKTFDYEMYEYDIKKLLVRGMNEIRFVITNRSYSEFLEGKPDHPFFQTNEKYKMNPYGIKYIISITYGVDN